MRESNQRSSFKPFKLPSRRSNVSHHSSPSSSRPGVIDQRLVDGSQQPRYTPTPEMSSNVLPSAYRRDSGDDQLDAFDLELLASEEREDATRDSGLGLSGSTRYRSTQVSRFFDPSSSVTPHRGSGYSSSDPVLGVPSSPLAFFRPKQSQVQAERQGLEPNRESYQKGQPSPQRSTQAEYAVTAPVRTDRIFSNIPPSIRGIVLVSVNNLPENYRAVFPFPLFNAVQSKSFQSVYNTNDNIVISAPTGSGKTVIMELAICRLLNVLRDERFKVVYQAPTKSLCSERFRDWHAKFSSLNLKCAELTGDTDHMQLRSVQSSQIITTTPEKWDSMTRKWKDHMKLMQLVKLFLIDEVHILKETRGATLEAVVSRMKNIGSNVRFVALSATVPNSEDIATWLGKDATNQHVPAHREHFGEEFRPVTLKKVVYGYPSNLNDFAFDKVCGSKLPEIIGQHSAQKPIMIFCCTRNSSLSTAKELARLWTLTNPPARLWKGPQKYLNASNEELKSSLAAGVAFHHAGLGPEDRHTVETGFKEGHISVICCTSTLAVGVNLPCHLVIIKNTVGWQDGRCTEYSDLEMMQMLGRAGRPQFDDSATAVILTKKNRVPHYERLVQGSESLESCLHLNLIDHLNAEIGLGNISDVQSAVKWLAGTFLFVRLRRNPTHYNLKEGAKQEDEDEMLRQICEKDISMLRECGLIETESLCSTPAGEAMARYYIRFETMKVFLSLKPKATLHETLNAISLASEFHEVRLKANEKTLYKEFNRDAGIRFPVNVDLALPTHKVSLLIQSELGAIDFPDAEGLQKHKFTFNQDKGIVFAHVNRLIRCLIDCQIARSDSISIRSALELARSLGARVWDHSPLQMKQLEQIGVVAVRKLAAAGITSMDDLECTEAHQIQVLLSKNPPFGSKLLARLREFPKLWVAVKMSRMKAKMDCVDIHFEVELAFMNDKIPTMFQRKPVHVCCMTERSDGHMIDFRRMSANKMQDRQKIELSAQLTDAGQSILCHVMCDEIAGTSRQAELKPELSAHTFAKRRAKDGGACDVMKRINPERSNAAMTPSTPIRKSQVSSTQCSAAINKPKIPEATHSCLHEDEIGDTGNLQDLDGFDGDDLELDDFLKSEDHRKEEKNSTHQAKLQLNDEDWFSVISSTPSPPKKSTKAAKACVSNGEDWATELDEQEEEVYEPIRLANGKWACNHKCKDKTSCKHFCCREGLDKPPPRPKKRIAPTMQKEDSLSQLTISTSLTKATANAAKSGAQTTKQPGLESKSAANSLKPKTPTTEIAKKPSIQGRLALAEKDRNVILAKKKNIPPKPPSSDYGDDSFDDLPTPSQLLMHVRKSAPKTPLPASETQQKRASLTASDLEEDSIKDTDLQNEKSKSRQPDKISPSTPKEHEIIELSDDTPPNATRSSIAELGSTAIEHNSSQASAEIGPNEMKRKGGQDDNENTKRFKRNPFVQPFQLPSSQAARSNEGSLEPNNTDLPVPRTWLDLNAEWLHDDIDMLEEFKNIVDFI